MHTALRRGVFLVFLAVMGGYAVVQLRGPNGLAALQKKREQIEALEAERERLEKEIERQSLRNFELENDRDAIEAAIRQRTNRLKPGEKEIRPAKPPRRPAPQD